ncbi:UDP-Glycosyltransferase/glycogen phosphorylase [Delitschia confertaspora ATCC 74209]|uniref:UDP-Glycosyltransferase/glycogen phosphorylase n=1 Tax=Delitschia confertaspora ATCC 74209 TaxID=1513339 RepID=A0A9P4JMJ1_9PLEO|nr:UDP-Glycosyltransferase/glycogen phosphorylase [Delitschia confertaspora ATCC 74209]
MTDTRDYADNRLTLTGADLGPIEISHPNGNTSNSTPGTPLKRAATNDSAPTLISNIPAPTENVEPAPRLSHLKSGIDSTSRPRMIQKFMTERPAPQARRSVLFNFRKRAPTADRAEDIHQVHFDPYASDSSSSDSSDEDGPVSSDKHSTKKPGRHRAGPFESFHIANENFKTKARVSKRDGRLKLSIHEAMNNGYFAKTLGVGLKSYFKGGDEKDENGETPHHRDVPASQKIPLENDDMEHEETRLHLNICIIVIGSRGDIQPFIKIGKILKDEYGHRVRIATHPAFKKFVQEDSGLEFFSVGGDPAELMAFMVKNPGLIPSVETITQGEVRRRRAAMSEMFEGMWRACINSTDDETDKANMKMMGGKDPFIADAIIANPPSFAPPHIAERLGIPLHMMFTFPYTPTVQFPHPLANIKSSNVDANYANFMSYPLVEMMTWQGLGDLINRFRVKTLCLEEVSTLWAPGQLYRLKVPYTYMWSPGLVPKPKDWGPEIDISGFVFLELASTFEPPEALTKFLEAGDPPVYIGFGSIVVDDPKKFTKLIFEAVEMAGVRALVSEGWGGIGDRDNTPDNIYILDNTPHDWLFPRVSAVVHHGGAGTTAMGLKCGKPTMIVPFFGDQPFWGAMVSNAKAGAHECIPYKKLTAERLAEGIKQCLSEEARINVKKIADSIAKEGDGARNAVRSFHRNLPTRGEGSMRCHILEERAAAWRLKNTSLHLSPLAAELLVEWKKIKWNELRLLRHWEWNDFGGPGEPITGGWGAIISTVGGVASGVGSIPVHMAKSIKKREQYWEKKRKIRKRQEHVQQKLIEANQNGAETNGRTDSDKSDRKNGRPAGPQRQETTSSKLSEPDEDLAEEIAHETGRGFKKSGEALLKAPMNLTLALTLGFHNAPRLYGDPTVRPPHRITGFYSGVRAGRDEFLHGVQDGVTGLWTLPINQAKEGGFLGFFRGVAMGFGGLILKDIAGLMGPFAFTMKGVHEEVRKKTGRQPTGYLRRARIVQGRKELDYLGQRQKGKKSKGGDAEGEGKRVGDKRREVELRVSRKWEKVQKMVLQEKKMNSKRGLKGRILGRKGSATKTIGPRKGVTQPTKKDASVDEDNTNRSIETGPKKGVTAPEKSLNWRGKVKKKNRVEEMPEVLREEARREVGVE